MANVNRVPNLNKGNPLHKKAEHKGAPSKPANRKIAEVARSSDPRIDVRIFKRKQKTEVGQGDYYARFMLYSRANPNFLVQCDMELDRKNASERDFEAGVTCGAMAERINELYGDNFDVEQCARHGAGQLQRVIDAWEKEGSRRD